MPEGGGWITTETANKIGGEGEGTIHTTDKNTVTACAVDKKKGQKTRVRIVKKE